MSFALIAYGKRAAAPEVRPVEYQNLVIFPSQDPDSMGYIFAKDKITGKIIWKKQIYRIFIWPLLERDVQWVFISRMTLKDDFLLIENERNERFSLNLKSKSLKRL